MQGMTAWRAKLFDAKRPFAGAFVVQGSKELAPPWLTSDLSLQLPVEKLPQSR